MYIYLIYSACFGLG